MYRAIQGHSVISFGKLCAPQYKLNINFNIYRKRMTHKAGYWCVKICHHCKSVLNSIWMATEGEIGLKKKAKREILRAS